MKLEISVSEASRFFNEIQKDSGKIFGMIRTEVQQTVSQYLTDLMNFEMTCYMGRKPYERVEGSDNYRNGSYGPELYVKRHRRS